MVESIAVYTEGPTEWYTVYQLYKRKIIVGANLEGSSDRSNIGRWIKQRGNISSLLAEQPSWKRILLLYDQEGDTSPLDTAQTIAGNVANPVNGYDNVFQWQLDDDTEIVLHVATVPSPDGNRDFDGYIVQLLDEMGIQTVDEWLAKSAPAYLRSHYHNSPERIHSLGRQVIPDAMKDAQWEILRSKTLIYAYVTALQADKSHVWFAERMIKIAPENVLERVFASLITAWNLLAVGTH